MANKKSNLPKTNDIINFYEYIPQKYIDKTDNPNESKHNIKLPFRMCIVAPSGSGKTNFLLNLIKVFSEGKGTFSDISIITSNKDEP
jgi:ABC-type lipoprotein export system ATPase subunit